MLVFNGASQVSYWLSSIVIDFFILSLFVSFYMIGLVVIHQDHIVYMGVYTTCVVGVLGFHYLISLLPLQVNSISIIVVLLNFVLVLTDYNYIMSPASSLSMCDWLYNV